MSKSKSKPTKWKACDISQLVTHFHQLCESQQERLGALHLTEDDIKKLFHTPSKIESFHIHMGLDRKRPRKKRFTFSPSLKVKYSKKENPVEKAFGYGPGLPPLSVHEVPLPFKEWLTKNWMELDSSLIDDAFMAFQPTKTDSGSNVPGLPNPPKRLLSYHFDKDTNKALFDYLTGINPEHYTISHMIFHLGIDKNKVDHQDQFNFSPVIELHVVRAKDRAKISDEDKLAYMTGVCKSGLRYIPVSSEPEGDDNIVFLEYVTPCPSTCPPQ